MFLVSYREQLCLSKTNRSLSVWKQLLALRLFWFACSQDGFVTWADKKVIAKTAIKETKQLAVQQASSQTLQKLNLEMEMVSCAFSYQLEYMHM